MTRAFVILAGAFGFLGVALIFSIASIFHPSSIGFLFIVL